MPGSNTRERGRRRRLAPVNEIGVRHALDGRPGSEGVSDWPRPICRSSSPTGDDHLRKLRAGVTVLALFLGG
jgi:hypothetical protein